MRIFVDIDDTICTKVDGDNYQDANPMFNRIAEINNLYPDHEIIYWTARGTVTGKDWRKLTERQFREWGVKYHQLKFGKPHFDLMICDKTFNPNGVDYATATLPRWVRCSCEGGPV